MTRHNPILYLLPLIALSASAQSAGSIEKGETFLSEYKFDSAKAEFKKALKGESADIAAEGIRRADLGRDMMAGRVERIEIIGQMTVPEKTFFKVFPLDASCGSIVDAASLTSLGDSWDELEPEGPAWLSEAADAIYTAAPADSTSAALYEGFRLNDGTWSEPRPIFPEGTDASFPFMMSDGCTFYFGSRSEEGLGGYDIFRSNRDNEDGSFQNPVNMGMPYNSPANDYMLAIDDQTGYGWWATDRNAIYDDNGDKLLTIYLFIPSEIRRNYDPDTENLPFFASLRFGDDPSLLDQTLDPEKDYTALRQAIDNIPHGDGTLPDQFAYYAPDGTRFTRYDQLPAQARPLMQRYQEALSRLSAAQTDLYSLYEARSSEDRVEKNRIDSAEKRLEQLRLESLQKQAALDQAL